MKRRILWTVLGLILVAILVDRRLRFVAFTNAQSDEIYGSAISHIATWHDPVSNTIYLQIDGHAPSEQLQREFKAVSLKDGGQIKGFSEIRSYQTLKEPHANKRGMVLKLGKIEWSGYDLFHGIPMRAEISLDDSQLKNKKAGLKGIYWYWRGSWWGYDDEDHGSVAG